MSDDAYAQLRDALPHDAFLRYDVLPSRVERVEVRPGAVAWTSTHPMRGVRWLTTLGEPPDLTSAAAALAESVAHDGPPIAGVTVPDHLVAALPAGLRPPQPDRWCWWWTEEPPAEQPGEADTVLLSPDDPRIAPLLAHSDSASVRPGDPRVRRWRGVVEGPDLIACAAHTEHVAGVPHLASVVTRPDRRGRGLAADVCARLTREALAEGAPVVTLGMYTGNDAARLVYTRLGFTVDKEFASGYLAGHEPPDGVGDPDVAPADGGSA